MVLGIRLGGFPLKAGKAAGKVGPLFLAGGWKGAVPEGGTSKFAFKAGALRSYQGSART